MWIARTKGGKLYYFSMKLRRGFKITTWSIDKKNFGELDKTLFSEVTWKSGPIWRRFIRPEWKINYENLH